MSYDGGVSNKYTKSWNYILISLPGHIEPSASILGARAKLKSLVETALNWIRINQLSRAGLYIPSCCPAVGYSESHHRGQRHSTSFGWHGYGGAMKRGSHTLIDN